MNFLRIAGLLCAAAMIGLIGPARAQEPSAAATALSREILELKGGLGIFDTVIDGVVEHHRRLLIQIDPNLDKDLTEVSLQLRAEYAARRGQIHIEIARAYASQFTEAELRQLAASARR